MILANFPESDNDANLHFISLINDESAFHFDNKSELRADGITIDGSITKTRLVLKNWKKKKKKTEKEGKVLERETTISIKFSTEREDWLHICRGIRTSGPIEMYKAAERVTGNVVLRIPRNCSH